MVEKGGSTEHRGPGFLDSLKARAEAKADDDDDEDGGFSLWMILLFGGVLLIMLNPDMRVAVGDAIGYVLEPIIGFDQAKPGLTIFFASLITGVASGGVRHYMMDHVEMARVQKEMKAFQNELKEARANDNNYRVKKLTELQPEIMKKQAGMSGKQFKPMGFTMVVVIPMFGWLWTFIQGLPDPSLAAPWGRTMLLETDPLIGWLPKWILMYSLFSIPIGQLVQKGLKAIEFSKDLQSQPEAA